MRIARLLANLKASSIESVKRDLVVIVSLALLTAFFTIYTFPGIISPGILLNLASSALAPVSVIVWLIISISFIRSSAGNRRVQRWFWVSGLSVVFFFASPFIARPTINQTCRILTHSSAQPLIVAIQEYRDEHDTLPQNLEQLIPAYLPNIPVPPCSFLTGIRDDKYLILRDVLTTNSADGFSCEDYSFNDSRWSVGKFDYIDYGPYCY